VRIYAASVAVVSFGLWDVFQTRIRQTNPREVECMAFLPHQAVDFCADSCVQILNDKAVRNMDD
jgi:hypothetical protein